MPKSAVHTRQWHSNGDSSNTVVTAVFTAVMGTCTVILWEQ